MTTLTKAEHCSDCRQKLYQKNFQPGMKVYVKPGYLPSRMPSEKKSQAFEIKSIKNGEAFFLIPEKEGGVNFEEMYGGFGYVVDLDYICPEEPFFKIGSTVCIQNLEDYDVYLEDSDKEKTFTISAYGDGKSKYLGRYFIEIPQADYDLELKKHGIWAYSYSLIQEEKQETQQTTEQKTMQTSSIGEQKTTGKLSFQDTAKKAGIRATSRTAIRAVRRAVLRGLEKYFHSKYDETSTVKMYVKMVSDFLDTSSGEALLSAGAGYLLEQIPMLSEKEEIQQISEELKIEGMALGMEQLFSFGAEHILPELQEVLTALPGTEQLSAILPKKARIAEPEEKPKAKPKRVRVAVKKESKEEKEEIVVKELQAEEEQSKETAVVKSRSRRKN